MTPSINQRYVRLAVFSMMLLGSMNAYSQSPDSWVRRSDFPGTARVHAASMKIGILGYMGTGADSAGNYLDDFWQYNPATDTWSQLASFPGGFRRGAVAMGFDTTGFLGLGYNGNAYFTDCWEYHPLSGTWSPYQDLGYMSATSVTGRRDATVVTTTDYAYILCGYDGNPGYLKDTWRFSPLADTAWARMRNMANIADITPGGRRWGFGFQIDNAIYYGCGYSFSQDYRNDFWKYDPITDSWSQVADFGGAYRSNGIAFSIYGKGYAGLGTNGTFHRDVWRYDPATNQWTRVADFGTTGITNAICISAGNRIFAGLGNDSLGNFNREIWEYIPDSTVGVPDATQEFHVITYPQPFSDRLYINFAKEIHGNGIIKIYDPAGNILLEKNIDGKTVFLNTRILASGIFFYSVSINGKLIRTGKLIKL